MRHDPLDVLVVGGSLAGLMAAIALVRQGHRVTVLERAPRHRPSGASLVVREADLRTILGAEHARAAVRSAGPRDTRRGTDVPATWAGLYEGLCRAAEAEPRLTLRHDTRVGAVGQDANSVWVQAGRERLAGDLLIGADGHRSLVRRSVAPEHPDAGFAGYVLWLGVAAERDLAYAGPWPGGLDIRDSGAHLLLGYPLAGPDGSTAPGRRRLGWAWYDRTRNEVFRELGAVRGGVGHHSLRAPDLPPEVIDGLAGEAGQWPQPWRSAITDSFGRVDFVGTPITEYLPERLVRGRMVLVGDAAHVPTPMTGRGFATSLDDAAALAGS
ncbi:FAD-dependent monooxygenase [Granulicoccus phenolivorans]|uniref:FAD-dependent monooxygenase n=1 Tax=Granulicoccus phenolivorans TaxID=266854 RepID=UPI00041B67A9|nr:FAD-dependent monooxygenase [Granulicoccus phenolivorans]